MDFIHKLRAKYQIKVVASLSKVPNYGFISPEGEGIELKGTGQSHGEYALSNRNLLPQKAVRELEDAMHGTVPSSAISLADDLFVEMGWLRVQWSSSKYFVDGNWGNKNARDSFIELLTNFAKKYPRDRIIMERTEIEGTAGDLLKMNEDGRLY